MSKFVVDSGDDSVNHRSMSYSLLWIGEMAQSTIVLCPSFLWIGEIAQLTMILCRSLLWIREMAQSTIVLCPSLLIRNFLRGDI